MQSITFTLSIQEANVIMSALGNMPFVQVAELVKKLQEQAQSQILNAASEPVKEDD